MLLLTLLQIGKFVGGLLALPVALLIAAVVGRFHPYVRRAVLLVERLIPTQPGDKKQTAAAGWILKYVPYAKFVPYAVIQWWIDVEVAILNYEQPLLWQILGGNKEPPN